MEYGLVRYKDRASSEITDSAPATFADRSCGTSSPQDETRSKTWKLPCGILAEWDDREYLPALGDKFEIQVLDQ